MLTKKINHISLLLILALFGPSGYGAPTSLEPLSFFSDLRSENFKSISSIDENLDKLMVKASSLDSIQDLESQVQFLKSRKKELLLRQEFLNRLILQFDVKFKGGDTQDFLRVALTEMAQVEVKSTSEEPSLWKFLNHLALSMKSLPKGKINVLHFVEGYMKSSSIEHPIEPKAYLSQLDYYNDVQAQRANGMSPTEAVESLGNPPF